MTAEAIQARLEVVSQGDATKLFMYGNIGESLWYSGINSRLIKAKLDEIKSKKIQVHIHSRGGDVFESIAIHNMLKQHTAEIEIVIDGIAASGASIIAMAGKKIIMPSNAMMMVHKASTGIFGNAVELRKTADDLDKINASVLATYTTRFTGAAADLDSLLTKEEFLTAEECMKYGFCDEITDPVTGTSTVEDEPEQEENPEQIIEDHIAAQIRKSDLFVAAMQRLQTTNTLGGTVE